MLVYSWNVNSLRNCEVKFLDFMAQFKPDIVCIQELRATEDQLSFFLKLIPGYNYLFNDSGRPGYSGTAVYYKSDLGVELVTKKTGNSILDSEGRVIYLKVNDLHIYNFYTPNGNSSEERYAFKLSYYEEMRKHIRVHIENGEKVIVGGDLNVAHKDIDTYYPKTLISGNLPEEKAWFDQVLELGMFDTFRKFHAEPKLYSWWNLRDPSRQKNEGWRFDYFLASQNLYDRVVDAGIAKEIFGSDHCPVWVKISV